MDRVRLRDKEFTVLISAEKIQERIAEIGKQMSDDMKGICPVFIGVLNGAFLFAADLMKHISLECEVTFVRVSSYNGTQAGAMKNHFGITDDIKGRSVVLLEDIIDSGSTVAYIVDEIKKHQPAQLRIAALLHKPEALRKDIKPDYVGFEVANDFLVGYGLDYHGLGRNLKDIYKMN